MESRAEKAVQMHHKGDGCAQAILCTYGDLVGLSKDMAYRMGEGLGKGLGGVREGNCSALTAAVMLMSMKNSAGDVEKNTKQDTYNHALKIATSFREQTGSILCMDLLGIGKPGIKFPCYYSVRVAARLLEEYFGDFEGIGEPFPMPPQEE